MQGDQRRRTRGIDREGRAPQIEKIRQPIGDDAQRTTGIAPRVDCRQIGGREVPVLGNARPDRRLRSASGAENSGESRRAPEPPTPLPTTDAVGDPSWRLREGRCRRIPRQRRRCRSRTIPTAWCGRGPPRPQGIRHRTSTIDPAAPRPPRTDRHTGTATTLPARRSHRGNGSPDRSPRSARPRCLDPDRAPARHRLRVRTPLRNRAKSVDGRVVPELHG